MEETETANKSTIVLVGMMGVGKSTVGRRLARGLGLPFFDSDAEIEQAAGMSVSDLFTVHGEASFRRGETRVIRRLLEGPPHVLATGGGSVTNNETRALIKDRAIAVWLRADNETLLRRATRRGGRPLLDVENPSEVLQRLLKERERYYAMAEIHVDSQPGQHSNTVDFILEKLAGYKSGALSKTSSSDPIRDIIGDGP